VGWAVHANNREYLLLFGAQLYTLLSNDMDQQEADDKHHRAGDAMNG
jgi:hypothetical protein